MARIDVVVTVDPGRWGEAVLGVQRAGLQVDDALEALGTLAGSVDEERLEAVAAVPGVEAVERSRSVQLPPPDAPIQ